MHRLLRRIGNRGAAVHVGRVPLMAVSSGQESVAREKGADLLSATAPSRLLSLLIVESSEKVFRALSDSSITKLFRSEHDVIRKAAALKCVRALPKRRLTQLLNNYVSGDALRYYNVVHWLDLGVSIPRDRARSAAETVLSRQWRN